MNSDLSTNQAIELAASIEKKQHISSPFIGTGVMLDLETMGTSPGSGILSIGAKVFNSSDKDFQQFYAIISPTSCYDIGLGFDSDTMQWWKEQNEEVREEAFSGKQNIKDALLAFSMWYELMQPDTIWSKGADFDIVILKAAYDFCELPIPWKYSQVRCFRTLTEMFPNIIPPVNEARHNALADAINQAQHAELIISQIMHLSIYTGA